MQIRLRDFTMEYEDRGEGRPLLWIHGFPLNRRLWQPQIDNLSDVARVLVPDLRWRSEIKPTQSRYTMDLLAKDCYELVNELEIKEPLIVGGLSMGGYVALAFYRNFPDKVAGMILASTKASPDDEEGKVRREELAAMALESGPDAIVQAFLPKMMAPITYQERPELVEQVRSIMEGSSKEGLAGALLGMKERPDSNPMLSELDRPVLIIHGANDQIIPADEARAMQSKLPEAELKIIDNAGHLVNIEQPEEFNRSVREYLKSIG
jgi:3-oxoadipate enol-lactonase